MKTSKRILVTGDFIQDHHIYEGVRHHYADAGAGVSHVEKLGGAALIHRVLRDLLKNGDEPYPLMLGMQDRDETVSPDAPPIPDNYQAYAFWRPTPKDDNGKAEVWRVSAEMGFGGTRPGKDADVWPPYVQPEEKVDIVVISDGGLGFRDNRDAWPVQAMKDADWIVLKAAAPIQAGALWTELSETYREKLVVVVSASELRKSHAQISSGLSWEETLESLGREIVSGGALENLPKCSHMVVAFEPEGALWVDLAGCPKLEQDKLETVDCHFVYQAARIEGDQHRNRDGRAFGFLSSLTAAIVKPLALNDGIDFNDALEGGLSAMHDLLENGHGPASKEADGFPATRLAGVINDATCRYSRAQLPLSSLLGERVCPDDGSGASPEPGGCWSLLREVLKSNNCACIDPAYDLAKLVVRNGPIALESLPHLRMEALMSVDRREIEALRLMERIVGEYKDRKKADKPLSIGVFGPPGSGKSFAVKQLSKALLGKGAMLEFNLSQFSSPDDLIGAFHQIRDRILTGQLPVAFFDEFDSQNYKWLQYLLAPMQDGAFQEGQITHPIGKCLFIFAGGTSRSFETFGPEKPTTTSVQTEQQREDYKAFVFAKGPDFKSRLDGFLNVNSPNRRHLPAVRVDTDDVCDIFFPIRRAFIARGNLGCPAHTKLDIDEGLLSALVEVETYEHGSRSLCKILDPLKSALPGRLYLSLIPPRGQLALHTNADDFLGLCREGERKATPPGFTGEAQRARAAKAIHETWEQLGVDQGWKEDADRIDYTDLSSFYEASNLAAADRMPNLLELVDLKLEDGENTDEERRFVRNKLEYHLELLAEGEHAGWMDWHVGQGWQLGPKIKTVLTEEPEKRTHTCLKPYAKLSDLERNKDRNSVRNYLVFAEAAGMRIMPV